MVEDFRQRENRYMKRVMARIKEFEYDPLPQPKQPEQACLANLDAGVKSILTRFSNEEKGRGAESLSLGEDYSRSSFLRISLERSLGSAFPRVFFMTWPMR